MSEDCGVCSQAEEFLAAFPRRARVMNSYGSATSPSRSIGTAPRSSCCCGAWSCASWSVAARPDAPHAAR
jgi:hypothetical protein